MRFTTQPRLLSAIKADPSILLGGNERGYNERADVVVAAADGTNLNEMWAEIQRTLQMYNDWRDTLLGRLTFPTNGAIDLVGVPSLVDFEDASEYGQPVSIRGAAKRNRGYTFKFYDLAVRYTWMFLAEADRAQLQGLNNQALEADNRLIFNRVMNCVFDPTNLVGVADSNIPVNVYKFYNADGEVPPTWKTITHAGSHTHYLTSGNVLITSVNLDALIVHLNHHGHSQNEGATQILLVNEQEGATIRGYLRTGGAKYDFIPGAGYGGGVFLPVNGGLVAAPGAAVPGEIGTYGPLHIVEENYIPAGYVVALASGGPFNLQNPIGFREHTNPVYRGLKVIPGRERSYPLVDSFYRRGFGVGVRQRGAGVVMQVTAGAYTVPSQYV
jgi:hypothetical protein